MDKKEKLEREVIGHALQYIYACNEYRYSKDNIYNSPKDYPKQLIRLFRSTDKLREVFNDTKRKKRAENFVVKTVIEYVKLMKQKSADSYIKEEITFSEAVHRAGLTLFEMEKYLVDKGFKSDYSIEDLEEEMSLLS